MDVIALHGCHLSTLYVGDAPIRIKNKNIHLLAVPAAFYCRTARIARGRTHNDDPLSSPGQHMIKEPSQQLQREIFERESGPVEQFK